MFDMAYLPFVIIFGAIIIYMALDRKNIEAHGPLLIRKTDRGKVPIINVARRFRRFWTWVGTIAVVAGFIASFIGIYLFLAMLIESIITTTPAVGAGVVLPWTVAVRGGGFVGVPVWYWLLAIISLLVVHEGLHGIVGASQGMKIKKLGWIILAVLPLGAFVEPDEEDVKKKSPMKQLRFFAAGSFANFLFALLIALVISPMIMNPVSMAAPGLRVYPHADYPFAQSQALISRTDNFSQVLNPKFILRSIDGQATADFGEVTQTLEEMAISPGQTIELNVDVYYGNALDNVDITVEAATHPQDDSRGYIGILFDEQDSFVVRQEFLPYRGIIFWVTEALFWIFLINLGVGLFNMMPIGPLDGGRMYALVFQRIFPKRHKVASRLLTWILFAILLAIIIPGFVSNFV
jgi:membrane-associated protease RseP (regulator of RpoE activity)